jgi:hypothetical protein
MGGSMFFDSLGKSKKRRVFLNLSVDVLIVEKKSENENSQITEGSRFEKDDKSFCAVFCS